MIDAPNPFLVELRAWQLVLPTSASFSHLTAARVLGWSVPPMQSDLPVFVSMDRSSPPERRGLVVSRHSNAPSWQLHSGLRVANPPEILLGCARQLSLLDLITVTDSALHLGSCSTDDLNRIACQRRRGAPALRRALKLVDARSESLWESMLRLQHVSCGIAVEPQHVLNDEFGDFVARGDLWLVGSRTLHEYDGAHHLTRAQQRKDLRRNNRIDEVGWRRRGYTKEDLLFQGLSILKEADRAIGRPHVPQRIRAWHALLRDSLHTPSGQARFRARLDLSDN